MRAAGRDPHPRVKTNFSQPAGQWCSIAPADLGQAGSGNMKILKTSIVLIVVILALTLLTLRVTGLEPEYLDLNQLHAHNMVARPGLWLKGQAVTTPVTDWSFVDK